MDPFTAIGGIGGSLISGIFGSQANAANLQFAQQQASGAFLPQYYANMRAAGINPLAGLGGGPAVSAGQVNPVPDLGATGVAVGKAIAPVGASKAEAVATEGQAIKNEGAVLDNAIKASTLQRLHSPDQRVDVVSDGRRGVPDSQMPFDDGGGGVPARKSLVEPYWSPFFKRNITALSKDFALTQFGPTAQATGLLAVPDLIADQDYYGLVKGALDRSHMLFPQTWGTDFIKYMRGGD